MTIDKLHLKEAYAQWTSENVRFDDVDGGIAIITPFLDRFNDFIEIAIYPDGEKVRVSDVGATLSVANSDGRRVTRSKQYKLDEILSRFDLEQSDGEIWRKVWLLEVPETVHLLAQAIATWQGATLDNPQRRPVDRITFDMGATLQRSRVPFERRVQLPSRSSFKHTADFVVRDNGTFQHHVISALPNVGERSSQQYIFSVIDTTEQYAERHGSEPRYVALFDDAKVNQDDEKLQSFRTYDIVPMAWSEAKELNWAEYVKSPHRLS